MTNSRSTTAPSSTSSCWPPTSTAGRSPRTGRRPYCCPDVIGTEDARLLRRRHAGARPAGIRPPGAAARERGLQRRRILGHGRAEVHRRAAARHRLPGHRSRSSALRHQHRLSPTAERRRVGLSCSVPLVVVAPSTRLTAWASTTATSPSPLADNVARWILSKDYNTWEINAPHRRRHRDGRALRHQPHHHPAGRERESTVSRRLTGSASAACLCGEGVAGSPSHNAFLPAAQMPPTTTLRGWRVGRDGRL